METIKASVKNLDDKYFIRIITVDGDILIPLSDDRPNEVKSAFNKLIARIKIGEFKIEMEESGDDLFSMVATEYLVQLNREIHEVHGEMKRHGLV